MVSKYKGGVWRDHQWKAKVFTQMQGIGLDKQIGCPDLLILLTSTVSHKMIRSVLDGIDEARNEASSAATPAMSAPYRDLENHSVKVGRRLMSEEAFTL